MGVTVPVESISTAGTATRDYLPGDPCTEREDLPDRDAGMEEQIFEGTTFFSRH